MVFLTTRLWVRSRVTDRYFRIQEVLKHARVSEHAGDPGARGPGVSAAASVTPCSPFLDPALSGEEEPLLPAGRQGCHQGLREMHPGSEAEEAELEDRKRRPAVSRPPGLPRDRHPCVPAPLGTPGPRAACCSWLFIAGLPRLIDKLPGVFVERCNPRLRQ